MEFFFGHDSERPEIEFRIKSHCLTHVAEYFISELRDISKILTEADVEYSDVFEIGVEPFDDGRG